MMNSVCVKAGIFIAFGVQVSGCQIGVITESEKPIFIGDETPSFCSSILDKNKFSDAINCFTGIIQNSEDSLSKDSLVSAYQGRFSAYVLFEEPELALDDIDKLTQIQPENPENFYNKGVLHMQKKILILPLMHMLRQSL